MTGTARERRVERPYGAGTRRWVVPSTTLAALSPAKVTKGVIFAPDHDAIRAGELECRARNT